MLVSSRNFSKPLSADMVAAKPVVTAPWAIFPGFRAVPCGRPWTWSAWSN